MSRSTLFVFLLLVVATPLFAQTDSIPVNRRAALLQRLHPGTPVRIWLNGALIEGPIQRVTRDTVYVAAHAAPAATLEEAWVQQRATRKGATIGAIIGAPAAAAFGGFLMLILSAESGGVSGNDVALGVLGFGAFGALSGAVLGGVIGAATPQWVEITSERARIPEADAARQARTRSIGALSLTPTFGHNLDASGGGVGLRASYLFQTRHFSFGPELGVLQTGDVDYETFTFCPGENTSCFDTVTVSQKVMHAGGLARVGTGIDNKVEPFATLGVGFTSWGKGGFGAIVLGGYSIGAGLTLRDESRKKSIFIDARYNNNLTNSGDVDPQYAFYTLGIGASVAW